MDRPVVLMGLTGTLLDERGEDKALDAAMRRVVSRYDVSVTPRELSGRFRLALMDAMQGEGEPDQPAPFIPHHEAVKGVFGVLMAELGQPVAPEDEAWFVEEYRTARRRWSRLFDDARRAVTKLARGGHALAIVTDADPEFVADSVSDSRMKQAVSLHATAQEAGHVKPHPRVFRLALDRLEVAPEEAVMVGASYERDLVGARAAGIRRVVLVDRHDARTVEVPRVRNMRGAVREVARWGRSATKWD